MAIVFLLATKDDPVIVERRNGAGQPGSFLAEFAPLSDLRAKATDEGQAYELNRLFHLILLDAAKNRFLIKDANALQKTLYILEPTTLLDSERATRVVEKHRLILVTLQARDGARAKSLMREHIEAAQAARSGCGSLAQPR